ncbi:UvrD-helicase domain-containing protein [Acidocella aromatica]|uniref:DNA 3'-5' helicase n=1 Tax=Acidocella aromatica TaxID=1303579 RepID=A0A840VEY4_9PROT|nr:UvrD-helicase domain-containing protein [Acidocella aromatica]MBB5374453.1 ATP-dependent exoDNAse (exonuclease V) beta subunit [Acidocella aromatica]
MSLDNLTIVTAGAGAGKTYRLTQDIIRTLRDEAAPVAGVLATSFTKKAAGEILLRVQGELAAKGMSEMPLHEALIGTVNSVCGRLLGDFAFEAGLSPALTVLEAGGAEQMLAAVLANAAATREEAAHDAAYRLGLSGEAAWSGDWQKAASQIVTAARANGLNGKALEVSRQRSLDGLLALLGKPAPDAETLDTALFKAMERLLKAAKGWDLDAETDSTRKALKAVQEAGAHFALSEKRYPAWADWARLAKLTPGAKRREDFAPILAAAAMHHGHPRLRADLEKIVNAAFDTAIKALDDYAEHKREAGLIDFTDQETLLLGLLEANAEVREELSARLHTLFVDEFQDTSPLQLALFLRLGALAKKSVWVGDPKQAIFGFRGTDPALMDAMLAHLGGTPKPENILSTSRRSRPALVEFANSLFVPIFGAQGMAKEVVALQPYRKDYANAPTSVQGWRLDGKNAGDRLAALAGQVAALLVAPDRPQIMDPQTGIVRAVRGGDIAILCRDNKVIATLAAALNAHGVEVTAQRDGLLVTPEVRLALACLRRLADTRDTLAAAEIAHLSGQNWLSEAVSAQTITSPRVAALDDAPEDACGLPPLAALDEALARAEILPLITRWPGARQRLANLEALRAAAQTYEDHCRSLRQAATAGGFIAWLDTLEIAPGQPEAASEHAVTILTYHRAKGLEWPLVVMAQLDKTFETRAFGVNVESDIAAPDPKAPLTGRWVRYWPWPYGRQSAGVPLVEQAAATALFKAAEARQKREETRLAYVGVTRARDMLILALPAKTPWLDSFAPGLAGELETIGIKATEPETPPVPGAITRLVWPRGAVPSFPALRVTPSTAEGETAAKVTLTRLGEQLTNRGGAAREEVGEVLHRFLAADDPGRPLSERLALAERLLGVWQSGLAVEDCLTAADRFWAYTQANYEAPEIIREWPVQVRLSSGEEVHGRLDALIRHAGGVVIIDHKSYPGAAAAARAQSYLPQLRLYRDALRTQGFSVIDLVVHFPVLGLVAQLHV